MQRWHRYSILALPVLMTVLVILPLRLAITRLGPSTVAFVVMLLWFLLVFAVLSPLLARRLLRTSLRAARGQCLRCGYDLRGNTSGVCPECGRRVGKDVGPTG